MASTQRARPVALIVLDGWGYRAETIGNAIALADTPTWDSLWARGSRTLLEASGLRVGLPDRFVTHGAPKLLHAEVGYTGERIAERVLSAVTDRSHVAGA